MADVTTTKESYRWIFGLTRGTDTGERTLSIDNIQPNGGGLSAAKDFRDTFIGNGSTSFAIIDPTQFIQPSGWKDNDPNEEPWTTTSCTLQRVLEQVTTFDGGTPAQPRNFRVEGASDESDSRINIYFDGDVQPVVYGYNGTTWQTMQVNSVGNPTDHYYVTKFEGITQASIYIPPVGSYEAYSTTIDVKY